MQKKRFTGKELIFEFTIDVKPDGKAPPGFAGPFVQGSAGERFVYIDIGTYAGAWKQNSGLDHFLFDAGLQLSLLKNTVNIYVPLIYSKAYKDYIQSYVEQKGRFWKTISFSIDISNFNLRKIDKSLTF